MEINIQKLVDDVSSPTAVCVLDSEINDPQSRKNYVSYALLNLVRQCVSKELYDPYIHIKDITGRLYFNDRLHIIKDEMLPVAILDRGTYEVHFVQNQDSMLVSSCGETPYLANKNTVLNQINFTGDGELTDKAFIGASKIIINKIKEKQGVPLDSLGDTNLVVHYHDTLKKEWHLTFFEKSFES